MSSGDRARLVDNESRDFDRLSEDIEAPTSEPTSWRRDTPTEEVRETQAAPEEPTKYTSQFAALLIIVNVTIGSGLLAMPFAMQTSGVLASVIVQVVFVTAIVITCIMCTELTVKTQTNSYHRLIQAHCHPYIYQLTQAAILAIVFGAVVAFLVTIGDQFDRLFASLYGPTFCHHWYMNRKFLMSFVTVFVVKPLCCVKTVDFLKYGSFAGVASLGFIVYVVISEFIKQGHVAKDVNILPGSISDIGVILPVYCIAFQCHLSWVPTVATIRKEEKRQSYVTIAAAMIASGVLYTVVSVIALLTFGSKISSDLTESYPGKSWPVITTVAILALKCIVTIPPAFFPARLSLVDIFSGFSPKFNDLSEPTKRISVTTVTLTIALVLALYVPDILAAVDILGCFAVIFIFNLPALAYLNLIKENRRQKMEAEGLDSTVLVYTFKDKWKVGISYVLMAFGTVMIPMTLYKSFQSIMAGSNNPPLCHAVPISIGTDSRIFN